MAKEPEADGAYEVRTLGPGQTILLERGWIKRDPIRTPCLQHRRKAAQCKTQMRQILSSITRPKFSN